MKRNIAIQLVDVDGVPMRFPATSGQDGGQDADRPLRLYDVARAALLAQFPDEQNLDGEQKYQRYRLVSRMAKAMANGGAVDLTAEEIALLKKLIGKGYGPGVVGPAFEALESDAE